MTLLVGTRSPGKIAEVRRLLAGSGLEVVFPSDLGLGPLPEEERLELHDTFQGNALAKAEHFLKRTAGLPTLADDSGLEVLSLGGLPGTRSRRWAGAHGSEDQIARANNTYLLERLAGAPERKRGARYRCVLVLLRGRNVLPEVHEGNAAGIILTAPKGEGGFGYDPLFFSPELGKTFGEATAEEKDAVSHRGRAFAHLLEALRAHPL